MRAARHVGIEKDRAEPHRLCAQGGGGADAAQAENAEGLRAQAAHLGGGFDFPTEAFGLRIEWEELAVEREREGDSVVGDFLGAVVGHVADRDSGLRGGADVDGVEADAVADNHAAVLQAGDHCGFDLRAVPEDDRVGGEDLLGDRRVKIQPHGAQVGDVREERRFHRGGGVGETKFPRANDDDDWFGHGETL